MVVVEGCGVVSSPEAGMGTRSDIGTNANPDAKYNNMADITFDHRLDNGNLVSAVVTTGDTIELGRVHQGEVICGMFTLHNDSSEPLVILGIKTGCGCTSVHYDGVPIVAAGKREVVFEFDSKDRRGLQIKDIDIRIASAAKDKVKTESTFINTKLVLRAMVVDK